SSAASDVYKRQPKTPARATAGRDAAARAAAKPRAAKQAERKTVHAKGDFRLPVPEPTAIPGARRAALPAFVEPALATLAKEAPQGSDWLHEIKFDGYRILCRIDGGQVRLFSRNRHDWTSRLPSVVRAAADLPARSAILDGEVVILRPDGTTSFQDLQNAIAEGGRGASILYYAFDLIHLDGYDLRAVPLVERKEALAGLVSRREGGQGTIRFSDHIQGRSEEFFRHACRYSLEGIVSKRADSPYRSGRSKDWLKIKCVQRQEFVIAGYTRPEGSREGFGALLLGVHDRQGRLHYAGRVGTGFTDATLSDLMRRMRPLVTASPAFVDPPRGAAARGSTWLRPSLVGEVEFTEWTRDGQLRHPSFKGLREDRDPKEVVREEIGLPVEVGGDEAEPEEPAQPGHKAKAPAAARARAGARLSLIHI
ncbi:MAG: non-homologous end-joining DNA ligase, partial [Candidatus Eisenbacteria bacterium]|nr:non-homologous end-joining DNA ligase [Candidatus Eisenbacteria bacterium]